MRYLYTCSTANSVMVVCREHLTNELPKSVARAENVSIQQGLITVHDSKLRPRGTAQARLLQDVV